MLSCGPIYSIVSDLSINVLGGFPPLRWAIAVHFTLSDLVILHSSNSQPRLGSFKAIPVISDF